MSGPDDLTRFWPDGTKVVYQDAADASEHRLRMMERGFEPFEQEEPEDFDAGDWMDEGEDGPELDEDFDPDIDIEEGFDDESDFEDEDE